MATHRIIKYSDNWFSAQGIRGYFWWDIFREYGKWQLSSIWGKHYGEFDTLEQALQEIGYRSVNEFANTKTISRTT